MIVGGVCKQYLIPLLVEYPADTACDTGTALARKRRDYDSNKLSNTSLYRASRKTRRIACFLNRLLYLFTLVIAQIAVIEIPADRRF